MSRLDELKRQGFDRSYAVPFKGVWKALCSQCEAVCLNGIPCHETGCLNAAKARRQRQQEERELE
jgi:hypothetical protein